MATAAKLVANRANATHSTGPADTSRTRFNGLAHGLTSKHTVIPGENQQEYDAFQAGMMADMAPGSEIESLLAGRVIAAAWRLKRFTRVESAFFTSRIDSFLETNPESDPDSALANLFTDPAEMTRLRLFLRYQNSVQREYDTAMRELQKAKTERVRNAYEQGMVEIANARGPLTADAEYDTITDQPLTAGAAASALVGFASQMSVGAKTLANAA
jgi:hypothetical protein